MATHTDENLLFGILALQMDFVGRDDLVAAMHAWVLEKNKPLGQLLCERGVITCERRALLDALVTEHLKQHGDARNRLAAAVSTVRTVQKDLLHVADRDVQESLASMTTHISPMRATNPTRLAADGVRYRRLRLHARGGLGEVFVAEDTELHREVALKEIQPHRADDDGSRHRFVLEAEITGNLEHPGIVPVYGLGVYPDGRPFYAMRLVQGESLKEAIERFHAPRPGAQRLQPLGSSDFHEFPFRQLLSRFVDACNAVAYAHSRGVLHRDIKPANVMLGKFGETLVVDWGLAKAGVGPSSGTDIAREVTTDPALHPASGSEVAGTQMGATLGTPSFMSPEQAAGRIEELGPASDIWSLGATLYVVLTGQPPFGDALPGEILARVQTGKYVPPRELKREIPSALDAICRKAMALRPADRYASALELAADLEHWLADEPVSACIDPWSVRLTRWARRRRTTVVAAAVLLVSAVVALSVSTALVWREQRRTEAQKLVAEENSELALDLSLSGIQLIESNEALFASEPATNVARMDMLKAASRVFHRYLDQQPHDPKRRERAATVFRFTANVHRLLNEPEEADRLYADAIRLEEGLAEQFPDELERRNRLSMILRDHASLQGNVGKLREAADSLHRAIEIAETLRAAEPKSPSYRRTLAAGFLSLASNEHARGMADSGKTAGQAATLFRELTALLAGQGHPYDPLLLAASLNIVAIAEREAGRIEPAREQHKAAAKLLQGMIDQRRPGVSITDVLHFMACCRLEEARTWSKVPRSRVNAEKNLGATALQWQRLQTSHPKIPMYREWRATAHRVRGQLRAEDGHIQDARADFEQSRELLETLVKEYPQFPGYRRALGRTYTGLGKLDRAAKNPAGAAEWSGKAVAELRQAVEQCPDSATGRRWLKEALAEQAKR
jgi:serine/threonine-protein kinase